MLVKESIKDDITLKQEKQQKQQRYYYLMRKKDKDRVFTPSEKREFRKLKAKFLNKKKCSKKGRGGGKIKNGPKSAFIAPFIMNDSKLEKVKNLNSNTISSLTVLKKIKRVGGVIFNERSLKLLPLIFLSLAISAYIILTASKFYANSETISFLNGYFQAFIVEALATYFSLALGLSLSNKRKAYIAILSLLLVFSTASIAIYEYNNSHDRIEAVDSARDRLNAMKGEIIGLEAKSRGDWSAWQQKIDDKRKVRVAWDLKGENTRGVENRISEFSKAQSESKQRYQGEISVLRTRLVDEEQFLKSQEKTVGSLLRSLIMLCLFKLLLSVSNFIINCNIGSIIRGGRGNGKILLCE